MSHVSLARRIHFNAGHRYWNDSWSPEKNLTEFGACTNPKGHGHSYVWDVHLQGPMDPNTGMILNLRDVDNGLREVVSAIDGQFINDVIPRFKTEIPTTEALLLFLTEQAQKMFAKTSAQVVRTRLYENSDLWVEWNAN